MMESQPSLNTALVNMCGAMATTAVSLNFVHSTKELKMSSVWETLSGIDVSEHTEEKNGLTYLSWAWAWGIVKKHYPTATYEKHLYDGTTGTRAYMLDEGGYGFVAVTVTIEGAFHPQW